MFTYLNNGTEKKEEYLPFHPRHNTLQQGYSPHMKGIFSVPPIKISFVTSLQIKQPQRLRPQN